MKNLVFQEQQPLLKKKNKIYKMKIKNKNKLN